MATIKTCKTCDKTLPITAFNNVNRVWNNICKECEANTEAVEENAEFIEATKKMGDFTHVDDLDLP